MWMFSLLWPFGTFLASIRKYKYRNFAIASLGIAIMYALCMQVTSTATFDADITRNLQNAADSQYKTWVDIFLEKDFLTSIIGKLACHVSDDLRFLGVIFEILNTLMFLRCIQIIETKVKSYGLRMSPLWITILVLAFSFWEINSLRFKLATTFYVWCALEYFMNEKSRFKYYSILSPFIHFGYFIAVPALIIYGWLKDRTKVVWMIFAVSFFLTTPAVSLYINSMTQEYMSESVANSVEGYASERGLEGMAERYAEGARMGNLNRAISRSMVDIRNYTVMACVGLLSLLCSRCKNKNKDMVRILNFLLLFYAFSNLANSNSQGVRFYATAALLAVCFFIVFIAKSKNINELSITYKRLYIIGCFIVCLTTLMHLYIGRDAANLGSVMFNNIIFKLISITV